MLQDSCDRSFEEGEVHEADAAQVRLLLVLSDHLAKPSNYSLGRRSKGHNALVLGWNGQVVQSEASQMTSISRFLGQAFGQWGKYIILSTAYHRDTVLLVADIAELVNSLCGGSTLFALLVQHNFDEFGDIIEGWWLRRTCLL